MLRCLFPAFFAVLLLFFLTGCVTKRQDSAKLRDLEYVVMEKEDVPAELGKMIAGYKKLPFCLTYADGGNLYLTEGYGEQEKTGYSVSVTEVYETEKEIHIHTNLMGPKKGEETKEIPTYPYVVVKLEYLDKTVVFD